MVCKFLMLFFASLVLLASAQFVEAQTECSPLKLTRGPDHYGKVVDTDRSAKTITLQFYMRTTCSDFSMCSDLRYGGEPGSPIKEQWFGSVYRVQDLGNNMFRFFLNNGKHWPPVGLDNVYTHWQGDWQLDPQGMCQGLDDPDVLGSSYPCID